MSAIEYILTTQVLADDLRQLAFGAGVTFEDVEEAYSLNRAAGWAAEYVSRVGVQQAWLAARERLQWGHRALSAYPVTGDTAFATVTARALTLTETRGNIVTAQATQGLKEEPQISFARQFSDNIALLVLDQGQPILLPKEEVGVDRRLIPTWTLCALVTVGPRRRLEVYADHGTAQQVAEAVRGTLGLSYVFPDEPYNVTLSIPQINSLADGLGGEIKIRSVRTHQDQSGVRKVRVEVGSAVADVRDAVFYDEVLAITDEGDMDIIQVDWQGQTYRLEVSTKGSFWFRAFTPRALIDEVLQRAEEIRGL